MSISLLITTKTVTENPSLVGILQGERSGMFYTSFHTTAAHKQSYQKQITQLNNIALGSAGHACGCMSMCEVGMIRSPRLSYQARFSLYYSRFLERHKGYEH